MGFGRYWVRDRFRILWNFGEGDEGCREWSDVVMMMVDLGLGFR